MRIYIMSLLLVLALALIFSVVINVSGSSAEDGKRIFDEKCNGCHGGRPNVPSISIISKLSEQDIANKIRNGVQGTMMRPFSSDELSDSDLNNVIAYLKNTSTPTNGSKKSPAFDINFGILGILLMYFIYNKKMI
jgi:mono/diheme cytochrome c family protein